MSFTVVTPRLKVVLGHPRHARAAAAWRRENAAFLKPFDPPMPAEVVTEGFWASRLAEAESDFHRDIALRLLILSPDEEEVLGTMSFTQIFRGALWRAILGYSLGQRWNGQGLMHEALSATIPWVFSTMYLHRIEANYLPTNERSGRLLRRLGFSVEGYARDYLFIDGAWRDHVLTALTNPKGGGPGETGLGR